MPDSNNSPPLVDLAALRFALIQTTLLCVLLLLCVPRLGISLQSSLLQIVGYRSLVSKVEKLRREPYDCENPEHEEMLMKVDSCLNEGVSLNCFVIILLLTCKN